MAHRPIRGRGNFTGDGHDLAELLRGKRGRPPTAGRIASDLLEEAAQGLFVGRRFRGRQLRGCLGPT